MEHTPGPWKYREDDNIYLVFHPYDGAVAEVFSTTDDIPAAPTEGEANARLIAAAPDLLAACEALLESSVMLMGDDGFYQCNHCGGTAYGGPSGIRHDNACATRKALAVIAAARGDR